MTPRLSIPIQTLGKDTLERTLRSCVDAGIESTDEVLIGVDGRDAWSESASARTRFGDPPFRWILYPDRRPWHWHNVRNRLFEEIRGDVIAPIDDDDVFTPWAFRTIRSAFEENPGRPHMFRIWHQHVGLIWKDQEVRGGNVGTPMFVIPAAHRHGRYSEDYIGDYVFVTGTLGYYRDPLEALVWRREVIVACRPKSDEFVASLENAQ